MLKNILTGGIDLPKLEQRVLALCVAVTDNREETNTALADHIKKVNFRFDDLTALVSSRALKEDVETLRQRFDRFEWQMIPPEEGCFSAVEGVETLASRIVRLERTVATLTKQVDTFKCDVCGSWHLGRPRSANTTMKTKLFVAIR